MKGLALFAASDWVNAQLYRRSYPDAQSTTGTAANAPRSSAARSTLQKQFDNVEARNLEAARQTYTISRTNARTLNADLLAEAMKIAADDAKEKEAVKKVFVDDNKFASQATSLEEEKKQDDALKIEELRKKQKELLDNIRLYALARIEALNKAAKATGDDKIGADHVADMKAKTQEKARDLIFGVTKERETSLAGYEKMLLFVGESAAIAPVSADSK